jgi:hypothetical protein
MSEPPPQYLLLKNMCKQSKHQNSQKSLQTKM